MSITHEVSASAGHAIQGIRAGEAKLAWHEVAEPLAPSIEVTSIAFEPNGALPISCTVDGVGAAPPLSLGSVPPRARSLAIVCEDPDAPFLSPYVHWLVYGIPPETAAIDAQTQHQHRLGENGKSENGFAPAAPPAGHGVHHYHFQVFALDAPIELGQGAERDALLEQLKGHVIAWGELVGTYERE